ncbi:WXG100-like domain-containing protein [Saccharopolyspora sp. 5N708]|uniref:WXG100-like domain-containing protein n=1 Tax=Saccharopolyspora sp. 5N708 TaxID=3457424 RepID=UPI003FD27B08
MGDVLDDFAQGVVDFGEEADKYIDLINEWLRTWLIAPVPIPRLSSIIRLLVGDYPEADEAKSAELGGAWAREVEEVARFAKDTAIAAEQLDAAWSGGLAAVNMQLAITQLVQATNAYVSTAGSYAQGAYQFNNAVVLTKNAFQASLLLLCFEIVRALIAAAFTWGASLLGIPPAVLIAQSVTRRAITFALQRVGAIFIQQTLRRLSVRAGTVAAQLTGRTLGLLGQTAAGTAAKNAATRLAGTGLGRYLSNLAAQSAARQQSGRIIREMALDAARTAGTGQAARQAARDILRDRALRQAVERQLAARLSGRAALGAAPVLSAQRQALVNNAVRRAVDRQLTTRLGTRELTTGNVLRQRMVGYGLASALKFGVGSDLYAQFKTMAETNGRYQYSAQSTAGAFVGASLGGAPLGLASKFSGFVTTGAVGGVAAVVGATAVTNPEQLAGLAAKPTRLYGSEGLTWEGVGQAALGGAMGGLWEQHIGERSFAEVGESINLMEQTGAAGRTPHMGNFIADPPSTTAPTLQGAAGAAPAMGGAPASGAPAGGGASGGSGAPSGGASGGSGSGAGQGGSAARPGDAAAGSGGGAGSDGAGSGSGSGSGGGSDDGTSSSGSDEGADDETGGNADNEAGTPTPESNDPDAPDPDAAAPESGGAEPGTPDPDASEGDAADSGDSGNGAPDADGSEVGGSESGSPETGETESRETESEETESGETEAGEAGSDGSESGPSNSSDQSSVDTEQTENESHDDEQTESGAADGESQEENPAADGRTEEQGDPPDPSASESDDGQSADESGQPGKDQEPAESQRSNADAEHSLADAATRAAAAGPDQAPAVQSGLRDVGPAPQAQPIRLEPPGNLLDPVESLEIARQGATNQLAELVRAGHAVFDPGTGVVTLTAPDGSVAQARLQLDHGLPAGTWEVRPGQFELSPGGYVQTAPAEILISTTTTANVTEALDIGAKLLLESAAHLLAASPAVVHGEFDASHGRAEVQGAATREGDVWQALARTVQVVPNGVLTSPGQADSLLRNEIARRRAFTPPPSGDSDAVALAGAGRSSTTVLAHYAESGTDVAVRVTVDRELGPGQIHVRTPSWRNDGTALRQADWGELRVSAASTADQMHDLVNAGLREMQQGVPGRADRPHQLFSAATLQQARELSPIEGELPVTGETAAHTDEVRQHARNFLDRLTEAAGGQPGSRAPVAAAVDGNAVRLHYPTATVHAIFQVDAELPAGRFRVTPPELAVRDGQLVQVSPVQVTISGKTLEGGSQQKLLTDAALRRALGEVHDLTEGLGEVADRSLGITLDATTQPMHAAIVNAVPGVQLLVDPLAPTDAAEHARYSVRMPDAEIFAADAQALLRALTDSGFEPDGIADGWRTGDPGVVTTWRDPRNGNPVVLRLETPEASVARGHAARIDRELAQSSQPELARHREEILAGARRPAGVAELVAPQTTAVAQTPDSSESGADSAVPAPRRRVFDLLPIAPRSTTAARALQSDVDESGQSVDRARAQLTSARAVDVDLARKIADRSNWAKWLAVRVVEFAGLDPNTDALIDSLAEALELPRGEVRAKILEPGLTRGTDSPVEADFVPKPSSLPQEILRAPATEVLAMAVQHYEKLLVHKQRSAVAVQRAEQRLANVAGTAQTEIIEARDRALERGLSERKADRIADPVLDLLKADLDRDLLRADSEAELAAAVVPEAPALDPDDLPGDVKRGIRGMVGVRWDLYEVVRVYEPLRRQAESGYRVHWQHVQQLRQEYAEQRRVLTRELAAQRPGNVAHVLRMPARFVTSGQVQGPAAPRGPESAVQALNRAARAVKELEGRLDEAVDGLRRAEQRRLREHAEYVANLRDVINRASDAGLTHQEIGDRTRLTQAEIALITGKVTSPGRAEQPADHRVALVDRLLQIDRFFSRTWGRMTGRESLAPAARAARTAFEGLDPTNPDLVDELRALGVSEDTAGMIGKPRVGFRYASDIHLHLLGYALERYVNPARLLQDLENRGAEGRVLISGIRERGFGLAAGSGTFYYGTLSVLRMGLLEGTTGFLELQGKYVDAWMYNLHGQLPDHLKERAVVGSVGTRWDIPGAMGSQLASVMVHGAYVNGEETGRKELVDRLLGRETNTIYNPAWVAHLGQLIEAANVIKQALRDGDLRHAQLGPELARLFPADGSLHQGGAEAEQQLEFFDTLVERVVELKNLLRLAGKSIAAESLNTTAPSKFNPYLLEKMRAHQVLGTMQLLHSDNGLARLNTNGLMLSGAPDERGLVPMLALLKENPDLATNRLVWAHLGVGNWTSLTAQHLQFVHRALDAVPGLNFDFSWSPLGQYLRDDAVRQAFIDLVRAHSDRLLYGSDTINPQPGAHYTRPYNELEPVLRELGDQRGEDLARKITRDNFDRLVDGSIQAGKQHFVDEYFSAHGAAWEEFFAEFTEDRVQQIRQRAEQLLAEGFVPNPETAVGPGDWRGNQQMRSLVAATNVVDSDHAKRERLAATGLARDIIQNQRAAQQERAQAEQTARDLRPATDADGLTTNPLTLESIVATMYTRDAGQDDLVGVVRDTVEETERGQQERDRELARVQQRVRRRNLAGMAGAAVGVAGATAVGLTASPVLAGSLALAGSVAFITRSMMGNAKLLHAQKIRALTESLVERGRLDPDAVETLGRLIQKYLPDNINPLGRAGREVFKEILDNAGVQFQRRINEFLTDYQAVISTPLNTTGGETMEDRVQAAVMLFSRLTDYLNRDVYGGTGGAASKRLERFVAIGTPVTWLVNLASSLAQASIGTDWTMAIGIAYTAVAVPFLVTTLPGIWKQWDVGLHPKLRFLQNVVGWGGLTGANVLLLGEQLATGNVFGAVAATTLTAATAYLTKIGWTIETKQGRVGSKLGPQASYVANASLGGIGVMQLTAGTALGPAGAAFGAALAASGPVIQHIRKALHRVHQPGPSVRYTSADQLHRAATSAERPDPSTAPANERSLQQNFRAALRDHRPEQQQADLFGRFATYQTDEASGPGQQPRTERLPVPAGKPELTGLREVVAGLARHELARVGVAEVQVDIGTRNDPRTVVAFTGGAMAEVHFGATASDDVEIQLPASRTGADGLPRAADPVVVEVPVHRDDVADQVLQALNRIAEHFNPGTAPPAPNPTGPAGLPGDSGQQQARAPQPQAAPAAPAMANVASSQGNSGPQQAAAPAAPMRLDGRAEPVVLSSTNVVAEHEAASDSEVLASAARFFDHAPVESAQRDEDGTWQLRWANGLALDVQVRPGTGTEGTLRIPSMRRGDDGWQQAEPAVIELPRGWPQQAVRDLVTGVVLRKALHQLETAMTELGPSEGTAPAARSVPSVYQAPMIQRDLERGHLLEQIGGASDTRRIERSNELIESVDGKPYQRYVQEAIDARWTGIRAAVAEGRHEDKDGRTYTKRSLGKNSGAVNALLLDRRYGLVVEAMNGRQGTVVPTRATGADGSQLTGVDSDGNTYPLTNADLLHAKLRELIREMAGQVEGPAPGQRAHRIGVELNDLELGWFPHLDHPHRHAEVKALDAVLKLREQIRADEERAAAQRDGRDPVGVVSVRREGRDVDIIPITTWGEFEAVLDDLYVDVRRTLESFRMPQDEGKQIVACCANCARILSGPRSLPADVRQPADLRHGALLGTGGFPVGRHMNPYDPNSRAPENTNPLYTSPVEIANPDYAALRQARDEAIERLERERRSQQ